MRRIVAIFFLLALATTWVKPYLPYLDYAINKDFIAENLCENKAKPELKCEGKCHLQKEIEKVVEKENSSDEPVTRDKSDIKISPYIQHYSEIDLNKNYYKSATKTHYLVANFCQISLDIKTPPPRIFSC